MSDVTAMRLNRCNHSSARGESRTRTGLPPADFESAASAIPPLGRLAIISPDDSLYKRRLNRVPEIT